MKKKAKNREVIPVDIRKIRQTLGFTMDHMGKLIAMYSHGATDNYIPGSRINEWEFKIRPTPDHVFTASANILLDQWCEDRHLTPEYKQLEVDAFYGSILNQPLGKLFKLELSLSRSRNAQCRKLVRDVRQARVEQMRFLESILKTSMGYVFQKEFDPENDDLNVVFSE